MLVTKSEKRVYENNLSLYRRTTRLRSPTSRTPLISYSSSHDRSRPTITPNPSGHTNAAHPQFTTSYRSSTTTITILHYTQSTFILLQNSQSCARINTYNIRARKHDYTRLLLYIISVSLALVIYPHILLLLFLSYTFCLAL